MENENNSTYFRKKIPHFFNDIRFPFSSKHRDKKTMLSSIVILFICLVFCSNMSFPFAHATQMKNTIDNQQMVVYAHRGYTKSGAAENTIESMYAAHYVGFSGVELDIHQTADGYFVINHDCNLSKAVGVDRNIEEMTLYEIKELTMPTGEKIPELSEYLLEAEKIGMSLNIEIKDVIDYDTAEQFVNVISHTKTPIIISSFMLESLTNLKQIPNFNYTCAYLPKSLDDEAIAVCRDNGYILDTGNWTIDEELITKLNDAGVSYGFWNVSDMNNSIDICNICSPAFLISNDVLWEKRPENSVDLRENPFLIFEDSQCDDVKTSEKEIDGNGQIEEKL